MVRAVVGHMELLPTTAGYIHTLGGFIHEELNIPMNGHVNSESEHILINIFVKLIKDLGGEFWGKLQLHMREKFIPERLFNAMVPQQENTR